MQERISQHNDLFCSFAIDDHAGTALRHSGWGHSMLGGGYGSVSWAGLENEGWGVVWRVYWRFTAFRWEC